MTFSTLIMRHVGIDDSRAASPTSLFHEIGEALVREGVLPESLCGAVAEAFLAREKEGTTALGSGLAIPHVFFDGLPGIHLVIVRHAAGIDFGALDGEPTRVLICFLAPPFMREEYLSVLRHVASALRDRQWRRFILNASSSGGIMDILKESFES